MAATLADCARHGLGERLTWARPDYRFDPLLYSVCELVGARPIDTVELPNVEVQFGDAVTAAAPNRRQVEFQRKPSLEVNAGLVACEIGDYEPRASDLCNDLVVDLSDMLDAVERKGSYPACLIPTSKPRRYASRIESWNHIATKP